MRRSTEGAVALYIYQRRGQCLIAYTASLSSRSWFSVGVGDGVRGGDGGSSGVGTGAGPLPFAVRDGLGDAASAVLTTVCDGVSGARTTLGVKIGVAVERWPVVGSCGGGGSDGAGFGDDVVGGLAEGEVADGSCGVVGGVEAGTDIAREGCIDD